MTKLIAILSSIIKKYVWMTEVQCHPDIDITEDGGTPNGEVSRSEKLYSGKL